MASTIFLCSQVVSHFKFLFNRLLLLGASHFPPPVVRSLLAIVQRGGKEKSRDLLWRTSLALLCELSTLNPELFLEAGGAWQLNLFYKA